MELVVRTTSPTMVESTTTLVIVPWIIESTGEMVTFMRFHHMAIDAKSEVVHAIYHQLDQVTGTKEGALQQLQFISRIITADNKPLWVIDLVGPCEFSSMALNSHFTGNAAGDITTIVMDGIPMQVIGGYGISAASHQGFTHPPLAWANLPTMPDVPLRYLADILTTMGCEIEGIVSILYAKADTIRTNVKIRQDRNSLNHKANSQVCPTIIFKSPSYLKYFLDHFAFFVNGIFPQQLIGHSSGTFAREKTLALYKGTPRTLEDFLRGKTVKRYLSNCKNGRHATLNVPVELPDQLTDYFQAASNLLLLAKDTMDESAFSMNFQILSQALGVNEANISAATSSMSAVTMLDSRYQSPNKRKASDQSGMSTQADLQKRTEAYAKERKEAIEAFAKEKEEATKDLETGYDTLFGKNN
jgi:hypothetical protein